MRTEFLCVSVIRVASGPRVKLASCKSALKPPVVYSTDRSKAVVPVLILLFVALWFILRGDLLYVFPCVILFLCFSVFLVLRLPRLGKRELILVLFVRSICACLDLLVSSSSWGLGRAAVCDCGTPWTFLLPFFSGKIYIKLPRKQTHHKAQPSRGTKRIRDEVQTMTCHYDNNPHIKVRAATEEPPWTGQQKQLIGMA